MSQIEECYIRLIEERIAAWDRQDVDELEGLLDRYEAQGFCIYELESLKKVQGSDWGNDVLAVDDSYRVLRGEV